MKLRDHRCHCGWPYPGFHICVDLSKPEPTLAPVVVKQKKEPAAATAEDGRRGSAEWRQNVARGMQLKNTIRDKKIIEHYTEGNNMREVGALLGINHQTVAKVLKREAEKGKVTIRPRGPARTSTRKRSGRDN